MNLNLFPTFLQILLTRFQIMSNLTCGRILNAWRTWQLRRSDGEAIKEERRELQLRGDHFNAPRAAQLSWLTRVRLQIKKTNIKLVSSKWNIFMEDLLCVKHSPRCCVES